MHTTLHMQTTKYNSISKTKLVKGGAVEGLKQGIMRCLRVFKRI